MGPKPLRATSRKVASELPETLRANFLTTAAQLYSTSLPQLSTHLGQQALLYANAQQAVVSSSIAKSQLCRKCGSPLNKYTCANVHIAWLSQTSSKRLSRKLPAHSSGQGSNRRGAKPGTSKQKNTVVAVRVCVACQEVSVRPFLSVGLAQKHLAAEGFTDVPIAGLDPKQQATARQQQKHQHSNSSSGHGQPHHLYNNQRSDLAHGQLQHKQQPEQRGHKRGVEAPVLGPGKRQAMSTSQQQQQQEQELGDSIRLGQAQQQQEQQHQQTDPQQVLQECSMHSEQWEDPQAYKTLTQPLQQHQTPEQQGQQHQQPAGLQQQQQVGPLREQQQQQVIGVAHQTATAGCMQQPQQRPAISAAPQACCSNMEQQKTASAIQPGGAAAAAAAVVYLEKADVPSLLLDTTPAVPDQHLQLQEPAACSPAVAAGTSAEAQAAQSTAEPLAASVRVCDTGSAGKRTAAQQQQPEGHVGAAPALIATTDVPLTMAVILAPAGTGDSTAAAAAAAQDTAASSAAALLMVHDAGSDAVVAAAAVATSHQPGVLSVASAVSQQPAPSGLTHSSAMLIAASAEDAGNTAMPEPNTPAAASPVYGTPASGQAAVAAPAAVVSAPLEAGMTQPPALYTRHPSPPSAETAGGQPVGAAAGTGPEIPEVQHNRIDCPSRPSGRQQDSVIWSASAAADLVPAAEAAPTTLQTIAVDADTAALQPTEGDALPIPADSMAVDAALATASKTPAAETTAVNEVLMGRAAAPDVTCEPHHQVAAQQLTASSDVDLHQAAAAVQGVASTTNTAAVAGEASCDPALLLSFTAADMANSHDITSALSSLTAEVTPQLVPMPSAAGGVRQVLSSTATRAAQRIATGAWPVAPMLTGALGAAAAAAVPGVLVIHDDGAVLDDLVDAAAAGQVQEVGATDVMHPAVKKAAQDAAPVADHAQSAANKVTDVFLATVAGSAVPGGLGFREVAAQHIVDDHSAQLAAAGPAGAPPAAPAVVSPPTSEGTTSAGLAAAAALQRGTSSGIEADVSREVDSEATAGHGNERVSQTGGATSPGSECRSHDNTAAAAAAAAAEKEADTMTVENSSRGGDSRCGDGGDGGRARVESDERSSGGGVPYAGPSLGGVRPAHAAAYESDGPARSCSQSQSQPCFSSAQEAGYDAAAGDEQPLQRKYKTLAELATTAAGHDSAAAALAAGSYLIPGVSEQHMGVDDDDFFAGDDEGEVAELVQSDDGDSAGDHHLTPHEDEGLSEDGYCSDSSEGASEGLEGNEQQQQQQQMDKQDADVQEEQARYARDSSGRGLQRAQGQQVMLAQQQRVSGAAELMQRPGEQQQQERRDRQRGKQQRVGVSRLLLRQVCTHSHLLRKQVGRKAMRHLVYR